MKSQPTKIIFINSHPIQYFAPLYAYCNKEGLKVEAWYCSDESIRGNTDVQFGKSVKWDIPLLEGYPYRFFKNFSWKPSIHNGFFGLINTGIIKALFKEPKSIVVVTGWGYLSYILVILFTKLAGHTLCLRSETPLKQEKLHSSLKLFLRKLLLRDLMFPLINKFLFVGKQNAAFCKHYGVKEENLVFTPYAVDNFRFNKSYEQLGPQKEVLKESFGIPADHLVILFSGKYIAKKRPLDLLKAFHLLGNNKVSLVMIGEGELRKEMESFIAQKNLRNIYLTSFINQSLISNYYAVGDVFVMCSQEGETWGLSVNEAMNFALPVIVSDLVGCSDDLVSEGENGFTFPCRDIHRLHDLLQKLCVDQLLSKRLGEKSKNRIEGYSYEVIKNNLQTLLY
jgi:glycosyltransferase involved in cell wall biosynthesis